MSFELSGTAVPLCPCRRILFWLGNSRSIVALVVKPIELRVISCVGSLGAWQCNGAVKTDEAY